MSRPIIRIHDLATDEIIDREMNDEEFKQFEKEQKEIAKLEKEIVLKKEAKLALLSKLGITEDEAKLLLG